MSAATVILTLKIAVIAVTLLFAASLVALWRGKYRLHGQINVAFFILTLAALLGLEVVARILSPDMFSAHFEQTGSWEALQIHLSFALPAALVLPLMLYTGKTHKRRAHIGLAIVFVALWTGTVITGVFFLPHE
jgi:uncharacterized membrane protein YozB (DUF420 family)